MRLALLSFTAGSATVCLLPQLPPCSAVWLALPVALLCCRYRPTLWLAAAILGMSWASLQCHLVTSQALPRALEGKPLAITGVVSSLPRQRHHLVQFRMVLDDCPQCWARTTVKLAWYRRAPWLKPGQIWRFQVRLKRPHGWVNPGLFNYEAWLLGKGISATGNVIPGTAHRLAGSGWRRLTDQLRYWLRSRMLASLPDNHITHLLVALTVGQSSQVSAADWQTLSDTGTNHLMVISGLHIGLVAGLAYRVLLGLLAWLVPSPTRWAGLLSLLIAGFYGAVAGMGLPVQRALVMATVAFSGVLLGRRVAAVDMYCYALFLVTLLDPLAVLSTGFWLSFGAVFVLLYAFAGRVLIDPRDKALQWAANIFKTQVAVFIGMAPLLMFFVFQVSLVALVVNPVAIPWVGMLVIPWLLLAIPALALWHWGAAILLKTAAACLSLLWHFLVFAAQLDWVFHAPRIGITSLLLALCGVLAILAPKGLLPRWPGLLMMLPALMLPPRPAPGEVVVRVLDVGERLTAIVHSRQFRLVYQVRAGGKRRFDMDDETLIRMLRRFGDGHSLDALVIGEGRDPPSDVLRHQFVVRQVISRGRAGGGNCAHRREIGRGDVQYVVLPVMDEKDRQADCALLVKSGDFAILLPAAMDAAGELALMHSRMVPVTVLVASRAGSDTASAPAFLNFLAPRAVVFSTAYGNRFGHPAAAVVKRYIDRGIKTYNTARDGAILIDYKRGSGVAISTARGQHQRFWYD